MTATDAPGVTAGVGRTALLVAHARALEAARPDPLAVDPYAEHFVRAAPGCANWPRHPSQIVPGDPVWDRLAGYFALRTRVLDTHLLDAARAGARQVVILGAGLDSRALRLPWPAGTTVWEVDQPGVLAFKQNVLDSLTALTAATPSTADRRTVPADLRADWTTRLIRHGFDPARPTAWLAEGLFLYLTAETELRVAGTLDALSAPGSSLAYEIKTGPESGAVRAHPVYSTARDRLGIDLLALFAPGPRPDTAAHLTRLGWTTTTRTPFDHPTPRLPPDDPHDPLATNRWITCRKAPRGCRDERTG